MTEATQHDVEQGTKLSPKFDSTGLLSAVVVDSDSREVLMVAFMDSEALAKTRASGLAHFHSRSRGRLWLKGESSGNTMKVEEIRIECDQDTVVLLVRPRGPACHTGQRSCFYRRFDGDRLTSVAD